MSTKRKFPKKGTSTVKDPASTSGDVGARAAGAAGVSGDSSAPNRTSMVESNRRSSRLKTKSAARQDATDEILATDMDNEVILANSLSTGATPWDRETIAVPTQQAQEASVANRVQRIGPDVIGGTGNPITSGTAAGVGDTIRTGCQVGPDGIRFASCPVGIPGVGVFAPGSMMSIPTPGMQHMPVPYNWYPYPPSWVSYNATSAPLSAPSSATIGATSAPYSATPSGTFGATLAPSSATIGATMAPYSATPSGTFGATFAPSSATFGATSAPLSAMISETNDVMPAQPMSGYSTSAVGEMLAQTGSVGDTVIAESRQPLHCAAASDDVRVRRRRSLSAEGYETLTSHRNPTTSSLNLEQSSMPRHLDQSVILPTFDGYGDLNLFLQKFESIAAHYHWSPQESLFRLKQRIVGDAEYVFGDSIHINTYHEFVNMLKVRFGSEAYAERYRSELVRLRRGSMTLEQLHLRVRSLVS